MVRLAAPLLALALTACAAAPARQPAAPIPQRVVSLNPCTDAILAEVADPQQIAALSAYSSDPAATSMDLATARRFPAIDGTVEELVALKPDLVIGSDFIAPTERAALGSLGLRYEAFGITPTVEASLAQVRAIAALVGHADRGERMVARIETTLAAHAGTGAAVPAVVWQSGGIVPGQGTLIADLLARTGYANAAARQGLGQADVLGLERLVARPPRVIFAAGNPRANEDRMLAHPVLARLAGTRRERLDPGLLWCGGPTIERTVARLGAVRRTL